MATILIAEDHSDVLNLISCRLADQGFVVLKATNGLDAVELARHNRPDLVLMDMHMPVLDGWQASCQFKHDRHLCNIPIIALTAYVLPGDQARARQAGCDDYHPKPLDFEILLRQIDELLARKSTS
jgi:two-component system, cell cycle response regulator DivK